MSKSGSKNGNAGLRKYLIVLVVLVLVAVLECFGIDIPISVSDYYQSGRVVNNEQPVNDVQSVIDIPEYSGLPYVVINNNKPFFTEADYTTKAFEEYSELDVLGRCGVAYANICEDLMPAANEERGDIGSIRPSGWKQKAYKGLVEGDYLYNRSHLIGWQLAGENDNELNLITGTRYMNVQGMLPFEDMVDDYFEVKANQDNHVLYRVTPIYEGNNLVASGVQMEAYSVEDNGEGVCFNVYVYNVQPGITIDYATGENRLSN